MGNNQRLKKSHLRARIDQCFHDKSCRIVYDDSNSCVVSEVVALHEVEWNVVLKEQENLYPWIGNLSLPMSVGIIEIC